MPSRQLKCLSIILIGAGSATGQDDQLEAVHARALSGGQTTVVIPRAQLTDRSAFSFPAQNLSLTRRGDHFAGNSFFQNAWVTAPASTAARDGLGPLFNTMSCQSCHIKDGRGKPPRAGEGMLSMLVRVSVPASPDGSDAAWVERNGVVPEPTYGSQIQSGSIGGVRPEARVEVDWETIEGQFADGSIYELRRPRLSIRAEGYGPFSNDALLSPRVAPALIGSGLLDAIAVETLESLADPEDRDGDGISGRVNTVWDRAAAAPALGRLGWKAEQPNVRQQVAAAFAGDIGLTSSLFPESNLTPHQRRTIHAPSGGDPEVSDEILDLVTFYTKTLAVPARRSIDDPEVQLGESLFSAIGCAACHIPTLTTGDDALFPELSQQTIHAYTDLLLHDLGEGLADGRPSFDATGSEWRTPPLWGIGLVFSVNRHQYFLHDGRARGFEEAILWHGGEAAKSAGAYRNLDQSKRRALLSFLKSL